jgi:Asp-tRNA(Asn)/Glu-tRNA(Gln) amidotransferase A subunit family amidase
MLLPHERHSMHAIQLVSVDLFNTLVDLSTGRHTLWHTILGESSTPARVEQAWTLTTQMLFTALDQLNATATYQSLHAVLQACYTEVFARLQVAFDPEEAARMAARYHAQRPWFPDAVPWLEAARRRYRLCVASDADEAMVGEHVRGYDVVLTPTVPMPPVELGRMSPSNPAGLTERRQATAFTQMANIAGHPAMSVPLYWNEAGLPIGIQFIGHYGGEATLFRLAGQLEQARPWFRRRPPLLSSAPEPPGPIKSCNDRNHLEDFRS